ncbi:CPBP family glutamic-type intramembrane protease [Marivirga sp.]|uniref:CPBP family glutamic-type intramembrane protease n=1 Tax=Marivirga sp. TaxID=2018662 RepID=UPI003DA6DD3B
MINIIQFSFPKENTKKFLLTFRLLGIIFLAKIVFSIISVIMENIGYLNSYDHPAKTSLFDAQGNFEVIIIFFLVSIVGPFIEELAFRLWVCKKLKSIILGLSFLLSFLVLIVTKIHKLIPIANEISFDLLFILIGILSFPILSYIFSFFKGNLNIKNLVFISSTLFAIVHLNIIGSQLNVVGYGVTLLPYFITGYVLCYARYYLGFWFGFLIHALNNLILMTVNYVLFV